MCTLTNAYTLTRTHGCTDARTHGRMHMHAHARTRTHGCPIHHSMHTHSHCPPFMPYCYIPRIDCVLHTIHTNSMHTERSGLLGGSSPHDELRPLSRFSRRVIRPRCSSLTLNLMSKPRPKTSSSSSAESITRILFLSHLNLSPESVQPQTIDLVRWITMRVEWRGSRRWAEGDGKGECVGSGLRMRVQERKYAWVLLSIDRALRVRGSHVGSRQPSAHISIHAHEAERVYVWTPPISSRNGHV